MRRHPVGSVPPSDELMLRYPPVAGFVHLALVSSVKFTGWWWQFFQATTLPLNLVRSRSPFGLSAKVRT